MGVASIAEHGRRRRTARRTRSDDGQVWVISVDDASVLAETLTRVGGTDPPGIADELPDARMRARSASEITQKVKTAIPPMRAYGTSPTASATRRTPWRMLCRPPYGSGMVLGSPDTGLSPPKVRSPVVEQLKIAGIGARGLMKGHVERFRDQPRQPPGRRRSGRCSSRPTPSPGRSVRPDRAGAADPIFADASPAVHGRDRQCFRPDGAAKYGGHQPEARRLRPSEPGGSPPVASRSGFVGPSL